MENKNILDYCAGVKIKGEWEFHQICIIDRTLDKSILQKTIRYYISSGGCKIMKINKIDGREIQLEAGKWMQQDLSKFEKKLWDDYNVDERYYLEKIYKEIHNICPPPKQQLSLF
jgi:hypothetical protein